MITGLDVKRLPKIPLESSVFYASANEPVHQRDYPNVYIRGANFTVSITRVISRNP
jgi:hypothetical protein